jgi:flagellar hook-basal body complex protein FliE
MSNKTGKTPYEIRLELLQLAQTILQAQHNARGVQNANNITTAPTTEDVMIEAEKLNGFVSKANN